MALVKQLVLGLPALAFFMGVAAAMPEPAAPAAPAAAPADSPEEAVRRLEAAIKAADVDGVLACCTAGFAKYLADNFEQREQRTKARAAFEDALDAKFGAENPKFERKPFAPRDFKEGFKEELERDAAKLEKLVVESSDPAGLDRFELRIRFVDKREREREPRKDAAAPAKDAKDGKKDTPKGKADLKSEVKKPERKADPWTALKEGGVWKLVPKEIQEARKDDLVRKSMVEQTAKYQRFAKEVAAGKYASRREAMVAFHGVAAGPKEPAKNPPSAKDEDRKGEDKP